MKKKKYPELQLTHWANLIENFDYSPTTFYEHLKEELDKRQIPGIECETIDFAESGPLSIKRQYYRITREGLVYDVCAAPFGTGFFVSYRLGANPLSINPLHILYFPAVAMLSYMCGAIITSIVQGNVTSTSYQVGIGVCTVVLLGIIILLAVAHSSPKIDAWLVKGKVLGEIYQLLFRPNTYFRMDSTLMFKSAVQGAVTEAVNTMTEAKGHRGLTDEELKPQLDNLFGQKKKRWKWG